VGPETGQGVTVFTVTTVFYHIFYDDKKATDITSNDDSTILQNIREAIHLRITRKHPPHYADKEAPHTVTLLWNNKNITLRYDPGMTTSPHTYTILNCQSSRHLHHRDMPSIHTYFILE